MFLKLKQILLFQRSYLTVRSGTLCSQLVGGEGGGGPDQKLSKMAKNIKFEIQIRKFKFRALTYYWLPSAKFRSASTESRQTSSPQFDCSGNLFMDKESESSLIFWRMNSLNSTKRTFKWSFSKLAILVFPTVVLLLTSDIANQSYKTWSPSYPIFEKVAKANCILHGLHEAQKGISLVWVVGVIYFYNVLLAIILFNFFKWKYLRILT